MANQLQKEKTPPAKPQVLVGPGSAKSALLKKFMEEETKMVKGRFRNFETEGGALPFTAGKYPGQPLFNKTFQDGEVYEVPLWVARWLNGIDVTAQAIGGKVNSCSYPIHGFKWAAGSSAPEGQPSGDTVLPVSGVSRRKKRYGFEALDFSTAEMGGE